MDIGVADRAVGERDGINHVYLQLQRCSFHWQFHFYFLKFNSRLILCTVGVQICWLSASQGVFYSSNRSGEQES